MDVFPDSGFPLPPDRLLVAAAKTGRAVNIKKGQFLSPESTLLPSIRYARPVPTDIAVTERGNTFGYQDLRVDFRGIPEMKGKLYAPVVLGTPIHSLQQPNQAAGVTGGLPTFIETISCAGIATGCDGIFIETHPTPATRWSTGIYRANMLPA